MNPQRLFPVIYVFCALIYVHFCEAATTAQNPERHSLRTSAISENEPDVQSLTVPRATEKKLRTSGYRSPRAGPLRRERPLCTSSTDRVEPIKRIHVAPFRPIKNRKQDNLSTDATDKPTRKVRYVYKRRRIANQVDKPSDKPVKPEESKVTTPAPAGSPVPEVTSVPGNKSEEEVPEVDKKPEDRRPVYKKKTSSTPPPPSSTLNPEEFSEESNKDDLGDPSLFPKQNEEKSTTEEKNTQARGKGEAKSVLNNPSTLKTLKDSMERKEETVRSGGLDKIADDEKAALEDKKRSERKRKNRRTSSRQQQRSQNEKVSRREENVKED